MTERLHFHFSLFTFIHWRRKICNTVHKKHILYVILKTELTTTNHSEIVYLMFLRHIRIDLS